MLLKLFIIFSICFSIALAEKNFWDNDICSSDSDCSGLTSCDKTFGCTLSVAKVGFVMLAVFLSLCVMAIAAACLCRRHYGNNRFYSRNMHYIPPASVIPNNPPQWNQNQMVTTTVYPHHPYPNQGYMNNQNMFTPPVYHHNQTGATINVTQLPTAPYSEHSSRTHYGQY